MKRFICGLFATIGLLCVLFSGPITTVLPYILGGTMTAVGICLFYPSDAADEGERVGLRWRPVH